MRSRAIALGWAAAAVAVIASLGALADLYARHGLTATYRAKHDGKSVVVTRVVEHRPSFPNEHRALSRYVQGWDFDRMGIPDRIPRIDVELEGYVEVPPGRPRKITAKSPNRTNVHLGSNAKGGLLMPGRHPLTIVWKGSFEPDASLALEWSSAKGKATPIPTSALYPKDAFPPLRRALFVAIGLLAAAFGAVVYFAFRANRPRTRTRLLLGIATAAILLVGTGYRLFDYEVMPEFRENADELFASWNGWQLLTDGTTRGWSLWPDWYATTVQREPLAYFEAPQPWQVVTPYFEHPPLLHLLAGAAAKIGGATHWAHARLAHTRLVPILLSAITMLLMLAIGRRLEPRGPAAFLGTLLYAVIPVIVLQGRVVKEEALLGPLALGSVLAFLRWRDDGEKRENLVLAAFLAGLGPLAKMPGVLFIPALFLLVLGRGRVRAAFVALGVALATASLLLLYAAWMDWGLFVRATQIQATLRAVHFNVYTRFFTDALINHNLIGRGWIVFLWIAWASALGTMEPRNRAALTVFPLFHLVGIGLSSGNWTYGWYMMPVYPFLCLGAGRFLADVWTRPDILRGTLVIVLPFLYSLNFAVDPERLQTPALAAFHRRLLTVLLGVTLAPFALTIAFSPGPRRWVRWLARGMTIALLASIVVLSGYFVARYDVFYDRYRDFDRSAFFNPQPAHRP